MTASLPSSLSRTNTDSLSLSAPHPLTHTNSHSLSLSLTHPNTLSPLTPPPHTRKVEEFELPEDDSDGEDDNEGNKGLPLSLSPTPHLSTIHHKSSKMGIQSEDIK